MWASAELTGYSPFPGLEQVLRVKKRVLHLRSGELEEIDQYAFTSLTAEEAGPERLLGLLRGHWGIENRLFHVKDDSFGEDRHVLASHRSGTVLSMLRATALNLLRGHCRLWRDADPLTARGQHVNARPLSILQDTS